VGLRASPRITGDGEEARAVASLNKGTARSQLSRRDRPRCIARASVSAAVRRGGVGLPVRRRLNNRYGKLQPPLARVFACAAAHCGKPAQTVENLNYVPAADTVDLLMGPGSQRPWLRRNK
jgi:hypothetical protein